VTRRSPDFKACTILGKSPFTVSSVRRETRALFDPRRLPSAEDHDRRYQPKVSVKLAPLRGNGGWDQPTPAGAPSSAAPSAPPEPKAPARAEHWEPELFTPEPRAVGPRACADQAQATEEVYSPRT